MYQKKKKEVWMNELKDLKFIHLSQWIYKLFYFRVLLKRACGGIIAFRTMQETKEKNIGEEN